MTYSIRFTQFLTLSFLLAIGLSLTGCGSTKVYTADKTIVHDGNIYNLGTVNKVGTRIEATPAGGEAINMKGKDKKAVKALLDQHDMLQVATIFDLDEETMVYQRVNVKSYRDYTNVIKKFESAQKKVTKFMGDKKQTQLSL